MRKIYLTLCCSLLAVLGGQLAAQDIHFAHIHASPTYLNPAMTGMFENGSMRFIANTRSQWETIGGKGYKTVALSTDGQLGSLGESSLLGGGLQLTADQAGDLNFTKSSASLTLSAIKSLNRKYEHFIAIGIQNAYHNYRLDYSKMVGFDSEPLVENGAPNKLNFWDLSLGAAWYYTFKDRSTMYLGAGLFHINTPNTSFFSRAESPSEYREENQEELYQKFVIHGGAYWRMGKQVTALPSFMYLDQGPHQEINIGTFLRFARGKSFTITNYAFYFGAWTRWHIEKDIFDVDAIITSLRMDVNRTSYTISFDTNVSSLSRASFGIGGPEVSIVKIIGPQMSNRKPNKVKCPAF